MENNKEKEQDQSQGKKATAETDMTYAPDTEALKNSATTSMADFDSGGSMGSGGGRVEAIRENDESNSPQTDK